MLPTPPVRVAGALALAALMPCAVIPCTCPAMAHTIVGDRVFPATLAIDDPGVNDELALPVFSYLPAANPDGTAGPQAFTLGGEYDKTITADLQLSIASEGVTFQRNPRATGVANIDVGAKYVLFQSPAHEFIVSGGLTVDIGGTGSRPNSAIPADQFTTFTPTLYVGKGFGALSSDWARPFAVTGSVTVSVPTVVHDPLDGSQVPTFVTYGGTVQYSLLYRNSFVEEVPRAFNRLIPAFEASFRTPVANTGPFVDGDFSARDTTGIIGPSLYYVGSTFEVGVMAQVPINRASGLHPGVMAILDFFLDDIAPDTIGKPLSGPPQSRFVSR